MAKLFTSFLFFLFLGINSSKAKPKVPAVIVFGDSSVDAGNNNAVNTMLKSNFRPYGRDFDGGRPTGRFCNGRIPPDFISEAFGLTNAVPAYLDTTYNMSDFATGVSFASAGTGYDNATSDVLNVIPVWKEVEYYKEYQNKLRSFVGESKANHIIKESLYLISMGTNDFLENYYSLPTRRSQFSDVKLFQDFLVGLAGRFVEELHRLGCRKISLTGVPPMGCLPLERSTNFFGQHECNKEYNDIALEFNAKLGKMVTMLNSRLDGLKMVFADAYGIFNQIITNPTKFGFEFTSIACCGTGMYEMSYLCNQQNPFTCRDASKFVFWDAFHPSEKTNRIVSHYLIPLLLQQFS